MMMASNYKLPVQESSEVNQGQHKPPIDANRDQEKIVSEKSTSTAKDKEEETTLKETLIVDASTSSYTYDSYGPSGLAHNNGCSSTNASDSDVSASSSNTILSSSNSAAAVADLSKLTLDWSVDPNSASNHAQSGAHDQDVAFVYGKLRHSGDVHDDVAAVGSLLSHSGSSSYSMIRGSSFDECTECQALDECIPSKESEDSAKFWKSIDRKGLTQDGCHIKLWSKFLAKLKEQFPEETNIGLKDMKTVSLLKTLLKVNLSDDAATVEYTNFVRVVMFFGPVRGADAGRCILLQQIQDVAKNSLRRKDKTGREKISWFAGDMSREEAETKLEKQKSGTYLIRMSGTRRGCFVISVIYVTEEGPYIHHFEIEGDYETAAKSNPFSAVLKLHGNTYHSLIAVENSLATEPLVDEEDDAIKIFCKFICPGLPLNGVISGYKKSRGCAAASNM